MKNRSILIHLLVGLFLLIPARSVLAVTLTISDVPTSVTEEPFSVNVSVDGANPGQNYLRIDLYKEGTTNYFGETENGEDWVTDGDFSEYPAEPLEWQLR